MGWILDTFKRWRDWGLRNLAKSTGSHFEPSCYPLQIHLAPNLWTALFKGRNVYQVNFHFSWKRNPPLSQMTHRPLQTWSRLFIEHVTHKSATQRNTKLGKKVGKGFLTVALPQLWDRDRDEPGRRSATGRHRRPRCQVRPQGSWSRAGRRGPATG